MDMFFKKPAPAGPIDFVIVGLGNPGKKYEGTRHNAGFAAIEALAEAFSVRINRVKFKSLCGEITCDGKKILLLMPQTFMNNSGEAVREALSFYKLPPEKCVVICDDVTLDVGTIRIRRKGSDGGQRGMRSIITQCASEQFPRVKIGVGKKPHPDYDLAAWVLSRFSKEEAPALVKAARDAADAALLIANGKIDKAMNDFSR
ncbi:MAG: aminoacyl-tRNA hydrolase [Clostridia bacterium]|nr:aminoacyl-tRNA hydrolase [Clostridia bacterium]